MKKVIILFNILFVQMVVYGQAGQVDPSFVCGYSDFYYNNADIQSDEKLLVSRGITDPASGSIGHTIHRFLNNGNDDNTFNKPYATGSFSQTNYDRLGILAIKVLSDDRIMVGGVFDDIRNSGQPSSSCVNLARLLPNGDIDPTFQFNLETYLEAVTTIFVNSEDEVIIGGDRTFSRIFEDGSIDESFGDNFFEFFTTIETIDQFSNGKYLVGGDLTIVYNSYLMRLLPDGNPDSSWDTGTGFNGKVTKVIIQPDQKILVIGSFSQFNGTPANRICRLNEDGTLDTSFDIGTGPNGTAILNDMILQPDGKIIIAGSLIYSFNGHNRQATVRLNSDGSVDTSYGETGYIRYDSQYPGIIRSLLQLPNSRIIAAGYFFNFRFYSGANFNSIGVMRLFNCTNSMETQTINACDSYTWIDGNTYYSDNNSATYTYTSVGGCDSTITLDLTISTTPTIDAMIDITACENYQLPVLSTGEYYTDSDGSGSQLGQGDLITSTQTVYIYAVNGTCSIENSFAITIDQPIIADALGDVLACESYELPSLSVGNYYTANNGGGSPLAPGDFITTQQTLYVYAENGECSNENQFHISIDQMPSTNVNVIDNMLTATQSGANYQWLDCINGNSPISGEIYQNFVPVENGSYAVIVENGVCSSTSECVPITIISSGINEVSDNNFVNIYPNPTRGAITIQMEHAQPTMIEIHNSLGEKVSEHTSEDLTNIITINGDAGVYFVKVKASNKTNTFYIIKQ